MQALLYENIVFSFTLIPQPTPLFGILPHTFSSNFLSADTCYLLYFFSLLCFVYIFTFRLFGVYSIPIIPIPLYKLFYRFNFITYFSYIIHNFICLFILFRDSLNILQRKTINVMIITQITVFMIRGFKNCFK